MTISESFAALLMPTTPEGAAFFVTAGMALVFLFWNSAH